MVVVIVVGIDQSSTMKGFAKSFVRAPQQFRAKFNLGDNTIDADFIEAERRFQELEKEVKNLHDESKKYFLAIDGETKLVRRNGVVVMVELTFAHQVCSRIKSSSRKPSHTFTTTCQAAPVVPKPTKR